MRKEELEMLQLESNALEFKKGTEEFLKAYCPSLEGSDVSVAFEKTDSKEVGLTYKDKKAVIRGYLPVHFYRGLGSLLAHLNVTDAPLEIKEDFDFKTFGNMIDCSRNSVLTVKAVKEYIRFLAACGMNMMMLYTEDTYEIKDYPYFGAYRSRYTYEELKEIDDYADIFGIEVVPCIQTLAHLKTALRWYAFDNIADTDDILLVEDEETYKFIEAEVKAASAPFRSKRIHVGMDEAERLGLGRYLRKNGYKNSQELMISHLSRVQKICEGLGLETIIWSDMFFRVLSPTGGYYQIPEDVETFPYNFSDKCHLTFWDYYHEDFDMYKRFLNLHLDADKDAYFAGGGWTWNGLCPNFEKAFGASEPAIKACKEVGIKNAFCTMWQDNGAETPQSSGLPSVLYFAELGYTNSEVNMTGFSDKLLFLTGLPFESFKPMSDIDAVPNRTKDRLEVMPSKCAIYQDPMIGLYDAHVRNVGMKAHFEKIYNQFENLKYTNETTDYFKALAHALILKTELGIDIVDAYKSGDLATLESIAKSIIPECISRVEKAHELRRVVWMKESKPFGFEIIDIRFAGVEARLKNAKRRIEDYLAGNVDSLPELLEPRLPIAPNMEGQNIYLNQWDKIASACSFTGV